jgi:hypothetical protein
MELRLITCECDCMKRLKIVLFLYSVVTEEKEKYGIKDKSHNNSSSNEADRLNFTSMHAKFLIYILFCFYKCFLMHSG